MVTGRSASGGDSSFWAIEKAMPPRGLFIALFSPVRFSNSLGSPKLSTRLGPRSRAISKQFEKMMTMQLASQRHSAHPVQAMRYVDIFRTQCRTRGPSEWRFSDPASSRPPRLNSSEAIEPRARDNAGADVDRVSHWNERRPSPTDCRTRGQRRFNRSTSVVPRAFESQAIAEISSAIGTLAFSGAALYGLAMSIRSANNMDEMDARLADAVSKSVSTATTGSLTTASVVVETPIEKAPAAIVDEKAIEARVAEARTWIGSWKRKTEEAAAAVARAEAEAAANAEAAAAAQAAAEAARAAKAEEKAAAAAALAKARADEEAAAAAAAAATSAAAAAQAEEARSWIGSWKKKSEETAKAAAAAAAQAAAEAAAADAAAAVEERKRIEAAHEERLRMEQAQAEAAERKAKEAEERAQSVAQAVKAKEDELKALKTKSAQQAAAVIKEMTEDAPVGVPKSTREPAAAAVVGVSDTSYDTATEKERAPLRRVSITAEYESKISSLVANYEKTKQRQREEVRRQPQQVVEVSAEELAKAVASASKKTNPVILFCLRIVAMIQACFEYVKSLITSVGRSGGSSPAATS